MMRDNDRCCCVPPDPVAPVGLRSGSGGLSSLRTCGSRRRRPLRALHLDFADSRARCRELGAGLSSTRGRVPSRRPTPAQEGAARDAGLASAPVRGHGQGDHRRIQVRMLPISVNARLASPHAGARDAARPEADVRETAGPRATRHLGQVGIPEERQHVGRFAPGLNRTVTPGPTTSEEPAGTIGPGDRDVAPRATAIEIKARVRARSIRAPGGGCRREAGCQVFAASGAASGAASRRRGHHTTAAIAKPAGSAIIAATSTR